MIEEGKTFDFAEKAKQMAQEKQATGANHEEMAAKVDDDGLQWDEEIPAGDQEEQSADPEKKGEGLGDSTKKDIYATGAAYAEEMVDLALTHGAAFILDEKKETFEIEEYMHKDLQRAYAATFEFYDIDIKGNPLWKLLTIYIFAYFIPIFMAYQAKKKAAKVAATQQPERSPHRPPPAQPGAGGGVSDPYEPAPAASPMANRPTTEVIRYPKSDPDRPMNQNWVENTVKVASVSKDMFSDTEKAEKTCEYPGCDKTHTNKKYCSTACGNRHRAELKKNA